MSEILQARDWPLGSTMYLSAGNPRRPQGTTGLRDLFTGDFINEDGVLTLEYIVRESNPFDENGDPILIANLEANLACSYISTSNGVHGVLLSTPETYELEAEEICLAKLVASAGVLAGLGQASRFVRLRVVEKF